MPVDERYPDAWKIACLAYLRAKREELRLSVGYKGIGWDAVRHLIMEPYDRENGGIASDLLNASTLDAWDRRGDASISDGKFKFIDQYIRRLASNGGDIAVMEMLRRQRFRDYAQSLLRIYNPALLTNGEIGEQTTLPIWSHRSRLTEPVREQDSRIAIKILDGCVGAFHLVCAMMPSSFRSLNNFDPRQVTFYEGVMVEVNPQSVTGGGFATYRHFFLAKLLRGEFVGLHPAGYADGEIYLRYENGNEHAAHLELRGPSSWFAPKSFAAEAAKPCPLGVSQSETRAMASKRAIPAGRILDDTTADVKLGQSGSEIWQREADFVDNIFNNHYRGYIDK